MYKVLLVDDEAIARIGLRATFDWEGYGYRLVGEASNGQKALKWIEKGDVDILITDIAMPVMDGLELTRRTRQLCPWVKVLLLSCHSDFEYVREGIRLGASDYILKPTLDPDSLRDVLDGMRLKLEEEKRLARIVTEHERRQQERRKQADERLLFRALDGEAAAAEELERTRSGRSYVILACQPDGEPEQGSACSGERQAGWEDAWERLRRSLYQQLPEALVVRGGHDLLVAWVPLDHPGQVAGKQGGKHSLKHGPGDPDIRGLRERMSTVPGCTAGFSRRHVSMGRIGEAFHEAKGSLEAAFFHENRRVFFPDDPDIGSADRRCGHSPVSSELPALKAALVVGNVEKSEGLLHSLMEKWNPSRMKKSDVLAEAEELLGMLSGGGLPAPLKPGRNRLPSMRSVEEVKRAVTVAFHAAMNEPSRLPLPEATLHERIVMQAISYINARYTEPISLQEVADEVAVSRNYFSELFKKVTGLNFIDYVIDLRVKRAQELLAATSLKVYEVAELSGFNDVKYFSKLFKKLVGMTPAEYQGLHRKG